MDKTKGRLKEAAGAVTGDEHLKAEGSIYAGIREKKELTDELTEKLQDELKKFAHGFNVTTD